MGNLLGHPVSGRLPFVGWGVEVDLQPVGFGDSWPKAAGLLWGVGTAKADFQRNGKILLPVAPAIGDHTRCNLKAV